MVRHVWFPRLGSSAAVWLAVGSAAGCIDGVVGLLVDREIAGPLSHRLHTLATSAALFGLLALGAWALWASIGRVRRLHAAKRAGMPSRLVASAWAFVVALAILGVACGPFDAPAGRGGFPNIVLISIDTLRADHLGADGYDRDTSPNLDELAEEGVFFTRAFAQSPWTLPSHATMMTGLGPLIHGAMGLRGVLPPSLETLAERLGQEGYDTAAFVGGTRSSFIGSGRTLDQGFGLYVHYPHPRPGWLGVLARRLDHARLKLIDRHVGNARAELAAGLRWVETDAGEPFFLFLHLFDVHSKTHRLPYEAPEPFRERFCAGIDAPGFDGCGAGGRCASNHLHDLWTGAAPKPSAREVERMKCLYDGGIAFVDSELGRFFAALRRLDLWTDTVVLVTSDHGEAFFEHGVPDHTELYGEVLRVPLILRGPGVPEGRRSAVYARTVDIAPTVLSLAGQDARLGEGRSLLPLPEGNDEEMDLAVNRNRGDSVSIRRGSWKYLRHRPTEHHRVMPRPSEELFDLASDPAETSNVIDHTKPDRVAFLRAELARAVRDAQRRRADLGGGPGEQIDLDDHEVDRLRALGYVE